MGFLLGLIQLQAEAFQKKSKFDYIVTIRTDLGEMKVILYDNTPKHKENFLKLIGDGFYDSLTFHRVIKDFMVQGGNPASRGDGSQGLSYRIPAEINTTYFHEKGALAAARQPDRVNPEKESSPSQFYIVDGETFTGERLVPFNTFVIDAALKALKQDGPIITQLREALDESREAYNKKLTELSQDIAAETGIQVVLPEERLKVYSEVGGAPHLDGLYTIFGKVILGLEVIDKIAEEQVGAGNVPRKDIRMYVSVERMKKKKITKRYGYAFD